MTRAASDHVPAQDDVIIRPAADATGRFTLGTLRAPRQFLCVSYDEAIAKARSYAKTSQVRVWRTDDDQTFMRVVTSAMATAGTGKRVQRTAS